MNSNRFCTAPNWARRVLMVPMAVLTAVIASEAFAAVAPVSELVLMASVKVVMAGLVPATVVVCEASAPVCRTIAVAVFNGNRPLNSVRARVSVI